MKKLLIVTDAWHPQINGTVTVLTHLQDGLAKRQYTVVLIHPEQFLTVPLPTYPEVRLALWPKSRIAKIISHEQPDYIHIFTEGPLGFSARSVCINQDIPFTTSYHTHFHKYIDKRVPGSQLLSLGVMRRFHKAAAKTLVATDHLRIYLQERGFTNLVVCPLGVDSDFFTRRVNIALPTLPRPVFAYAGRLAPEKNIEEFLSLDLPGTKLVIGDGPDRARLQAAYAAHFVGYKRGQDFIDWLSLADVLVFPSQTDTFGIVILEALACGIPVAAYDVQGPRDILTNSVDGYLNRDLAHAARSCLSIDPNACRMKALRYSWDTASDVFTANLVSLSRSEVPAHVFNL